MGKEKQGGSRHSSWLEKHTHKINSQSVMLFFFFCIAFQTISGNKLKWVNGSSQEQKGRNEFNIGKGFCFLTYEVIIN